ncbi:MAG: threonine synthase, partial [Pseudomonadota bacterium]
GALERLRAEFSSGRLSEAETLDAIRDWNSATGEVLCPHSAIGVAVGEALRSPAVPMITLATAHPAKFPDAVEKATGIRPDLPPHMADLFDREERCITLPNDVAVVRDYVAQHAGRPRS